PYLFVADGHRVESPPVALTRFTGPLPGGEWVRINIPLSAFKSGAQTLDLTRIAVVGFRQNQPDQTDHILYLDDIRIRGPEDPLAVAQAPLTIKARGFERHIDLSWPPAEEHGAFSLLISRSADGATFRPAGTQRAGVGFYTDWVGETGGSFWYQVTALNEAGVASPPSAPVQASTRPMTDEELLTMVQESTFRYFWENAHPVSGLARENTPGDENLVTTGASGFGVMTLPVGVERGFVQREAAAERMLKILRFLAAADRFHGAWGHFMDGRTGRLIPLFGKRDNGGDLVETAFLIQGLLAARSYFDRDTRTETEIRRLVTSLWQEVEWDWYRRTPASDFLFWHWSPDQGWVINHPLIGWNETMIVYLLAVSSPTHPVPPSQYYSGWAGPSQRAVDYRRAWSKTSEGDHYANGNTYYGIRLEVGCGSGGPLFFAHYSFLGFDPHGKLDQYTDYFANNRNLALINREYCIANPGGHEEFGPDCWGLTASDDPWGYAAHAPDTKFDNGTMTPTGAVSSIPYTPQESMQALRHYYRDLGDRLWGIYGFRDAFNLKENWFAPIFMALNEGPIVVMIENQRSRLLWNLFMKDEDVRTGLKQIGFATQ
ncbi:MAG TPA: glucoamylase family protein, partial [Bacteroidota bacterium]